MIAPKCPKCGSSRIRKGYKRTLFVLRLVGIHHLLCDHCNLLFTGFVLPGTLKNGHRKKHRNRKKGDEVEEISVTSSATSR